MKLMRVGAPGRERPSVRMADGTVIDVSSVVNEYDGAWLAAGGMGALESRLNGGIEGYPIVDTAAERIGAPKAARAVGAAIGRNPISFVVPCHRVLGKAGALTGYHWGITRKRAMLGWECGVLARDE